MIRVIARATDGFLSLTVSGHSEAAPKGQDVICAAVSAITQTALLGLQALALKHPEHVEFDAKEES